MYQGRRAPSHRGRIDHKYHRQDQPFGDFSGAACFGFPIRSVEETHHALGDAHRGSRGGSAKNLAIRLGGKHPAIEVSRCTPANSRMMAAVDEVKAAFLHLHPYSTPPSR